MDEALKCYPKHFATMNAFQDSPLLLEINEKHLSTGAFIKHEHDDLCARLIFACILSP